MHANHVQKEPSSAAVAGPSGLDQGGAAPATSDRSVSRSGLRALGRVMRKALPAIGATVALLAGLILARTATYGTPGSAVEPVQAVAVPEGAAERLAGSLRIRTISHEDPAAFDAGAFQALHAYLEKAFPNVHAQL